jgi:signal transduction histidine kinase
MCLATCSSFYRITSLLAFVICTTAFLFGQTGYHVGQYTSKEGLPQNSIKGLAFDQHGFLWLATEGGIARFNGSQFTIMDEGDHRGLRNQRFTLLLPYQDTSMLFLDHLNGMYVLSNDRFYTVREPDANYSRLVRIVGSFPHPDFIKQDSFFLEEAARTKNSLQLTIIVLPLDQDNVVVVSDRVVFLNLKKKQRSILSPRRDAGDEFALLGNTLLKIDSSSTLSLLHTDGKPLEQCSLINMDGSAWNGTLNDVRLFSQYPFEDVFVLTENKLYKLLHGPNRLTYVIQPVLDLLPENCIINAIAYRKTDDALVIGTDTRGVFMYHRKNLNTYIPTIPGSLRNDTYYGQCLLDSSTIVTGNGLMLDINTFHLKGSLPAIINEFMMATDIHGQIYYIRNEGLIRYNPITKKEFPISYPTDFKIHCITMVEDTIWIGTNIGIGQVIDDSIRWAYQTTFASDQYGIKSINKDAEGNLWFASYFELYRLNKSTAHVDSFSTFTNADIRDITKIRNKLFIGTYGHGYFVFHDNKFTAMPKGRQNELSNTHTFIEDKDGYLWMSTNLGLYKIHLDAVESFLQDTTQQLDYYAYLEEDGIVNTEFNGGCSPSHLALPDGRYSLPSLEGLVVFDPLRTPHYFPKDSVVIEYIEVDGILYRPEQLQILPADHSNIRIHYASAWWNRLNNQYIYLGIDKQDQDFHLSDVNQTSYAIGHLPSGSHLFVIKRRCGFGPNDFVISRLSIHVDKVWYARGWVIGLFILGLIMLTWGTSILYARSIRERNILLRRKVDEQTKELLASNVQLEENVNKLAKTEINLRKNIKVRDRLISIITHDILTPLRFIGQIARLGADEKQADAGLSKRALTDVQNAVHKLFHSTQNLLHWVTYHQEQFKTTAINCSPFAVVEQLIEDFSEMSNFHGNTLSNEVPEDDVIITDPRILTIILHNLLSNAIKYTKNGVITVRSTLEHNWYLLEVSDTGRGMIPAQIDAVKKGMNMHGEISITDVSAGNGIGLSLVSDLVQALRGRWEIDSLENSGVRVRIYIPTDPVSDQ